MEEPERFLRDELGNYFTLKEKSIGPPTQYLGNKVNLVTLENGCKCWSFSSSQYVQNAVKNVEEYRERLGMKSLKKAKSSWPSSYRPEADISPELSSAKHHIISPLLVYFNG